MVLHAVESIFESWLASGFVRTLPWASQLRIMDLFFAGERVRTTRAPYGRRRMHAQAQHAQFDSHHNLESELA